MLPFKLTGDTERALQRLDELKERLDHRLTLPRRWYGRLRRDLEVESVAASTSMEGVPVTVDEVRRILIGDTPSGVTSENAGLVRGYREAMSLVLRRADEPGFRYSAELIKSLNDRILAGDYAKGAGLFRPGWNAIQLGGSIVYEPPSAEAVPGLIDALASWLEDEDGKAHAAVASAYSHITLAAIHPFRDGNGRTARVLASLVMYRRGYTLPEFTSLEEWWGRHKDDYYRAFHCLGPRWEPEADVTSFIEAHILAELSQVEALSLKQPVERAIWDALRQIVDDRGGRPRQVEALFDGFFGREVTNSYYRGLSDISPLTAANDLRELTAAGLLVKRGGGRSTSYTGSGLLLDGVAEALGVAVIPAAASAALELRRVQLVETIAERVRG